MRISWADRTPSHRPIPNKRLSVRTAVMLPARLTWKDARGSTRFASVIARDVSEHGVYVECTSPVSIPLFRLVQLQLEHEVRDADGLPIPIRQGRVLAAVYRVIKPNRAGAPQGLALRLLVEPGRRTAGASFGNGRLVADPLTTALEPDSDGEPDELSA